MPKLRVQSLRLKLQSETEASEHQDQVKTLAKVVLDAAWGVSREVVASHHVAIDIFDDIQEQPCQSV